MKRTCKKCGKSFNYSLKDAYWDEKGFGYSTKLIKCPNCSCNNIIKIVEDEYLDVNNDERFYYYNIK